MFGRRTDEPLLPIGGSGSSRMTPRGQVPSLPPATVVLSISSLVASLVLVFLGIWSGQKYSDHTSFTCDAFGCTIEQKYNGVHKETLVVPRERLINAEMVRVSNGTIVDTSSMSRKAARKYSQSYAISFKEEENEGQGAEQEEGQEFQLDQDGKPRPSTRRPRPKTISVPLSAVGKTRKKCKSRVARINRYIRKELDEIELEESQYLTMTGGILVVIGVLALFFTLLLGEFSTRKKQKKKN